MRVDGVEVERETKVTVEDLAARRQVGALIRRRREARGLSQTEFGAAVGLTQRYVSKIEVGGVTMPRDPLLRKIGAVLGLTLAQFYEARGILPPQAAPALPQGYNPYPDARLTDDEVQQYVLNHPDPVFHERVRRCKEWMPEAMFVRFCRRTYRAHHVNLESLLEQAEEQRGEMWERGTHDGNERNAIGK